MMLKEIIRPYAGPVEKGVDNTTLYNKVMCGYQGWFAHKLDGYTGKNMHWAGGGGLRLVWNENFLARFEVGASVEGYGIYIEIFSPY